MTREGHARFWERPEVKFLRATRQYDLARTPRTVNGYNGVHWTEKGVSYWAISDLVATKLEAFSHLFRTAAAEP